MAKASERNLLVPVEFYSTLKKMSLEDVGRLFMAGYDYLLSGEVYDFSTNGRLDALWDQYKAKIDRDGTGWDNKRLQSSYAGWCSSLEKAGTSSLKLTFEDWKIERQLYDDYCKTLSGQQRPLFDYWLTQKRDLRIEDNNDSSFPDILR